ncbi:hypothetical protein Efla_000575 [Eimeria flavescens]
MLTKRTDERQTDGVAAAEATPARCSAAVHTLRRRSSNLQTAGGVSQRAVAAATTAAAAALELTGRSPRVAAGRGLGSDKQTAARPSRGLTPRKTEQTQGGPRGELKKPPAAATRPGLLLLHARADSMAREGEAGRDTAAAAAPAAAAAAGAAAEGEPLLLLS